ncbi:MAG TPA: M14 metallopeptidase family protein [Gemmatimonadaceae bacterium]|nr:M14 metallopeptidase family protein [Gemmatimonadaceae bacterium]
MLSDVFRRWPAVAAATVLAFAGIAHPASAQTTKPLPSPETVFGFPVGADYKLFTYDQSIDYFKRLAAASNRIRLITVGKTSFGKPWTAAIISSPANLARLDQIRAVNMRLAHPEGVTDSAARRLASQGRAIVDISGGLHASEIAGSQHTPQVAYELLSRAAEPNMKAILDSVVFFLWPSINPDGQDIVVNWCRARDANPGQPAAPMELYQKYVGHDNNRDSYMLNVIESRVIQRTWREWEPDIIYVQHQSSPFPTRIWLPPFADPVGLRVPPIMAREVNAIGTRIAEELDANGQPGAVSQLETYDAWYPGYIDYMPMYQNIAAWWTETQGGNCATPRTTTVDSLPPAYRDLRPTSLYVSPWAEGTWGLRDAVNYMVTADLATLNYAAKFKTELLYNRYQAARNTIAQFRKSPPYAYIIPQTQYDPVAPAELLQRMAFMGVRVKQLGRDAAYNGTTYPRGTWVIPMDQEFAQLVRELFEPQKYPDLGDDTPYDAAGWTLPYQMNVKVVEAQSPLPDDFRNALLAIQGKPVDWHTDPDEPFTTNAQAAGIVPLPGEITGSGDLLLLDPAQNNSFKLIARALAAGATLRYAPASAGGSAGARYVVAGLDPAKADAWVKELFVHAERASAAAVPGLTAAPTRFAIYKSSPGVMDEGWTEWLLDTYGYKYALLTPTDVRAGNLGARFDVIVTASQGIGGGGRGGRGGGGGAGGGGRGGRGAAADSATAEEVRALDEFVRGGGTVVAWNQGATSLATALRLPVRNVVAGVNRRDFFTGGSIMQVVTDPTQPVMAGMPPRADVFVFNSPVFTTTDGFNGSVLAKFPSDVSPLRSGFLNGQQYMQGFAAALDVKHDRGHVVLLGFQPQWRGQPTGTFRTVFNSLFFARDIADQAKPMPDFWVPPPIPSAKSDTAGSRRP